MFLRDGTTAWEKPFPATFCEQALTKCARGHGYWGEMATRYVSTTKGTYWVEWQPPKRYRYVLILRTCERDLIWRKCLCICS